MSRSEKRRRQAVRERARGKLCAGRSLPRRVEDGPVERARRLIEKRQWEEARRILEEVDHQQPRRSDVLRLLIDVYHHQREIGLYCRTCERYISVEPADRAVHLMLAGGYEANGRLAMGMRKFQQFVERWPDDPLALGARMAIKALESAVRDMLAKSPFARHEQLELAAMHEQVLYDVSINEFQRAISTGEKLLLRAPDFIPVMNNLSMAYFQADRTDAAVAMAHRVLERDPDNFFAIANLAQHLFLSGRAAEAAPWVERIRSLKSDRHEIWNKKAEVFALMGDDDAILEAMNQAAEAGGILDDEAPDTALFFHLSAVAAARKGDDRLARNYWEQALSILPDLEVALDNLDDADQPLADRHGPWFFSLDHWLRKPAIEALSRVFASFSELDDASSVRQIARRHPEIVSLVPALLDRGDDVGREYACRIAQLLNSPDMHEALRQFGLSQRGPDYLRADAIEFLTEERAISETTIQVWLRGKWETMQLQRFEVTDEPIDNSYPPEVDDWFSEATQAVYDEDFETAERLIKQCIAAHGETPEFLNNLAATYQRQGRSRDAWNLSHEVQDRWPDYLFGKVARAREAILKRNFDKASDLLVGFQEKTRFHSTEFAAVYGAFVELHRAQGNLDAAQSFVRTWASVQPDHPDVQRHAMDLDMEDLLDFD